MNEEPENLLATQSIAPVHQNLSLKIHGDLVQSQVEGGVCLEDLPPGAVLRVATANHVYRLVNHGKGKVLISGHPEFCPSPVLVMLHGSNWGGSLLKSNFIGRGMRLEFQHPLFQTVITSPILELQQID